MQTASPTDRAWMSLEGRAHEPFLVIPQIFSRSECGEIAALFATHRLAEGMTRAGAGFSIDHSLRKLMTAYIPRSVEYEWIFERMDRVFFAAARYWGFEVRETVEDLKYLIYEPGCHFSKWHADIGDSYASRRKLSLSVELDDSSSYSGGDLQIFPADEGHVAGPERAAGTGVVFPSHRYHRVTAVTAGTRRSLVNWISGPPLT